MQPDEMPAITMAFVLQIWFFAVLLVVAALAWRQARPRRGGSRPSPAPGQGQGPVTGR